MAQYKVQYRDFMNNIIKFMFHIAGDFFDQLSDY